MEKQVFEQHKEQCPSQFNGNGCTANSSGRCKFEHCPFAFWMHTIEVNLMVSTVGIKQHLEKSLNNYFKG